MSLTRKIGFIGTGVMGRSMAGHLLRGGHSVHVYNRTRSKAQTLLDAGAQWHDTPASLAATVDVVITMLGFPSDVEEIYLGAQGLIATAKPGTLLIDMTTSSPALAARIAVAADRKKLFALDAPVSGGDLGAREARLVIMVGGAETTFEATRPLFELMGKNIVRHGGPGAGQHCKMANQIAVAASMLAWVEALAYAKSAGLEPSRVLESISGGAAGSWSMTNLAPRALSENYAPGFYVKHFLKDMRIALEAAAEMKLDLPGLACAKRLYDQVAARGWSEDGTQALYKLYTSA
jgi:3-hydroxyisobutyrate dehydrogenase